ncbi:MAG: hypothetical protein Q7S41_03895, partial [Candidatus Limnocylindria bacterium]|nr:hypothetical protein [Candidatus Limnocylindria bacterium]
MQDTRGRFDRRTFLKLSGATAAIAACGGAATAPTATPAATSAATAAPTVAKPTGRISVYSALNESTNNEFVKAFKAAVTGVEVDLLP